MKLLSFLNLLDAEGKISITNTAMYAIMVKVLVSDFDWPSAVALFTLCLNYMDKRRTAVKALKEETEIVTEVTGATAVLTKEIDNLKSQISSLMLRAGIK